MGYSEMPPMRFFQDNERDIVRAFYSFSAKYHADYISVRRISAAIGRPGVNTDFDSLAGNMLGALSSWGAGRRKAPKLKERAQVAGILCEPETIKLISEINAAVSAPRTILDMHSQVFELLRTCATIFYDNTNITYPSKALLLLTGVGPALDSNVRKGLVVYEYKGFRTTQYLMPKSIKDTGFNNFINVVFDAAQAISDASWLSDSLRKADAWDRFYEGHDPGALWGRIADILLFQVGNGVLKIKED